jgi:hypothetical protein
LPLNSDCDWDQFVAATAIVVKKLGFLPFGCLNLGGYDYKEGNKILNVDASRTAGCAGILGIEEEDLFEMDNQAGNVWHLGDVHHTKVTGVRAGSEGHLRSNDRFTKVAITDAVIVFRAQAYRGDNAVAAAYIGSHSEEAYAKVHSAVVFNKASTLKADLQPGSHVPATDIVTSKTASNGVWPPPKDKLHIAQLLVKLAVTADVPADTLAHKCGGSGASNTVSFRAVLNPQVFKDGPVGRMTEWTPTDAAWKEHSRTGEKRPKSVFQDRMKLALQQLTSQGVHTKLAWEEEPSKNRFLRRKQQSDFGSQAQKKIMRSGFFFEPKFQRLEIR